MHSFRTHSTRELFKLQLTLGDTRVPPRSGHCSSRHLKVLDRTHYSIIMADFLDLNSRASKLQKEQQKRREAARSRIKRERATKEAAARDQAKFEEHNRQRKLEQLRKEEEVR